MGEAVHALADALVAAQQEVVAEHRRNRYRQAHGGHDQCLADRAGDLVDRGRAGAADAHQRVVNAPDRAEQADKRRGGTNGGEDREAGLQACLAAVQAAAQVHVDPVAEAEAAVQLVVTLFVVFLGLLALQRKLAERTAVAAELVQAFGQAGAVPELVGAAGEAVVAPQVPGLDQDHGPGGDRHEQQDQRRGAGDPVALCPEQGQVHGGARGNRHGEKTFG